MFESVALRIGRVCAFVPNCTAYVLFKPDGHTFDFRSVHIDYAVKQAFRNKTRIKAQAVQSGTENLLVNHESLPPFSEGPMFEIRTTVNVESAASARTSVDI